MTLKRHLVTALRGSIFVIPLLYLLVVLWLQPANQMGPPPKPRGLGRLLYDDYDVAAMALRGVNAHLGHIAGRADVPEGIPDVEYQAGLNDRERPYQPTYYLEYPHATLLLFRMGYAWQADFEKPPAVVCDGDYFNIVHHVPQEDDDRQLWHQFRLATQTYEMIFVLCLLGLMFVLRQGYEPGEAPGPVWLCVLPGALYFTLSRFDIVPTLLTALSFWALGHKRFVASAALLAAATAIKVYPVLLAPLVFRYLWDRREPFARWAIAYVVTLEVFFLPVIVTSGWESFWSPYKWQLNRSASGPTLYGVVFPHSWGGTADWARAFRLGTVLSTTAVLMAWPMSCLESLLRRGAIAVFVFVALAVFFSPQWSIWFLPFLMPLSRGRRCLLILTVAFDLITYLSFPVVFDRALPEYFGWLKLSAVVTARFVIMGVLVAMLAKAEINDLLSAGHEQQPAAEPSAT